MNNKITAEDRALLIEGILKNRCETLLEIDTKTGEAIALKSSGMLTDGLADGVFDFPSVIKDFLYKYSADPETNKVIEAMSLNRLQRKLRLKEHTFVQFMQKGAEGEIRIKKAAFFQKAADKIFLMLEDVTEEVNAANSKIRDISHSFKNTSRDIEEKSAVFNLFLKASNEDFKDMVLSEYYLSKISMCGINLNEALDDITELRSIVRGNFPVNPKPLQIQGFLDETRFMIEPLMEERQLIFSMDTGKVACDTLLADSKVLRQIFLKLSQSGMNYTLKGGRILLKVLELSRKSDAVELEISLNIHGLAIETERLEKALKPYKYIEESFKRNPTSLELDLLLLKNYTKLIGSEPLKVSIDKANNVAISLSLRLPIVNYGLKNNE